MTRIPPPWLTDPNPDNWVSLEEAATKFRKGTETIRKWAVAGTIRSYFDGWKWWVRLDLSPTSPSSAK